MDLLERIFGAETMARVREEARQAQARALAQQASRPTLRRAPPARAAQAARPTAVTVPQPVQRAAGPSAGEFTDALPADFPTSILGTVPPVAPPLLTAFGSREALLAAIVYSEALAPPLALREEPFERRSR